MSDEIKVSRPQVPQMQSNYSAPAQEGGNGSSKMPWIILAIVVVLLVLGGILFRGQLFGKAKPAATGSTATYQAVFLTNGQVYFGRLSDAQSDYVTLKDIYYLQVGPQQGSGASTTPGQSISLVKLGQELHGPVDEMHISRSQILFYEDLKGDGQVVKAIEQDKSTKK